MFQIKLKNSLITLFALAAFALFAAAPAVTTVKLFGVNLPWLLLGVVAFPFLVAVGWAYVHLAERNEQDFTAVIRRPEC